MSATATSTTTSTAKPVLPSRGVALVKYVLSGDTVVLSGRATQPGGKAPEVTFTFERVTAPRMASKGNNNVDEPGAFPSREWLRNKCIGKSVQFETRKQGATAGDRVYGLVFMNDPYSVDGGRINLAVESVRRGHATPKVLGSPDSKDDGEGDVAAGEGVDDNADYETQLQDAFQQAKAAGVGIHAPSPLVRKLTNAGEDFGVSDLVDKSKKICPGGSAKCVIEYVFDGSRFRCLVTDPALQPAGMTYGSFTLILAGVACPRAGNPRSSPPTESEPFADEARAFVEARLLHRELDVTLCGTDKAGACAVGTLQHPKGNIAVELLKRGFGRVSEWSARLMDVKDLPAFRIAENNAKRSNMGIWHDYTPPTLSGAAEIEGTVIEVVTGDTLMILPHGETYDDESKLKKVSLASVRSPRVGNERLGKPDEPFAAECKDRLRLLTVGKPVKVTVNYERDIPIGTATEKRQFGTVSVGKREDVAETLIYEGLALTQRHRDEDEKSARYDELVAAESEAMAAKRGVHSESEHKSKTVNDLTDPRKAKSYSGSLMRAGTLKAVVEYVFSGARYKLHVPSENCSIIFALSDVRCPQPSPPPTSTKSSGRAAEPFGDNAKRHARISVLQRNVEINCGGVTNGGVITGSMSVGTGTSKRDFGLELVCAGLGTVDQRKIDYGEAPKSLVDAQDKAEENKVGLWALFKREKIESNSTVKSKVEIATISLSEIRAGNHFFYRVVGDESAKVIDDSMRLFTENNGTDGAPCDLKVGKVVAALFDDGSGKSWYRARIVEKKEKGKVKVLFVDHGNVSSLPLATHLRPLEDSLGTDRIPAVAKEALLALTEVRPLDDDEGHDAAVMLQKLAWGKDMSAHIFCEVEGKVNVALYDPDEEGSKSVNEHIVSEGLGRASKQDKVNSLKYKMSDSSDLLALAAALNAAQEQARKSRSGMWRYGDIGEDDEEY